MWLLPSRKRPHNLKNFFTHYSTSRATTPGIVLIDQQDYSELKNEYDQIQLPINWKIRTTSSVRMGDKVQEVLHEILKENNWVGLLSDDHIPRTPEWDIKIVNSLTGWNFISTDDGIFAPQGPGPCGAICYSGELIRKLGWIFPKGIYHCFHDDIWEILGRSTGSWQIRMDVLVEHNNAAKAGHQDETHRMGHDNYESQRQQFIRWSTEEQASSLHIVRSIRNQYLTDQHSAAYMYCHALDLFSEAQYVLAIEAFDQYLKNNTTYQNKCERAIANIYISRCHVHLNSNGTEVIEYLFKAIGEASTVKFTWNNLVFAMLQIKDYPNCFAACLNSMRSNSAITDLCPIEPRLQFNIQEVLEICTQQLGIKVKI